MIPAYFQWEVLCCYIYKLMSSQMSCRLEHTFSLGTPGDSTNYWIIYCLHRAEKNSLWARPFLSWKTKHWPEMLSREPRGIEKVGQNLFWGARYLLVSLFVWHLHFRICLWVHSEKSHQAGKEWWWLVFFFGDSLGHGFLLLVLLLSISPPCHPPTLMRTCWAHMNADCTWK